MLDVGRAQKRRMNNADLFRSRPLWIEMSRGLTAIFGSAMISRNCCCLWKIEAGQVSRPSCGLMARA